MLLYLFKLPCFRKAAKASSSPHPHPQTTPVPAKCGEKIGRSKSGVVAAETKTLSCLAERTRKLLKFNKKSPAKANPASSRHQKFTDPTKAATTTAAAQPQPSPPPNSPSESPLPSPSPSPSPSPPSSPVSPPPAAKARRTSLRIVTTMSGRNNPSPTAPIPIPSQNPGNVNPEGSQKRLRSRLSKHVKTLFSTPPGSRSTSPQKSPISPYNFVNSVQSDWSSSALGGYPASVNEDDEPIRPGSFRMTTELPPRRSTSISPQKPTLNTDLFRRGTSKSPQKPSLSRHLENLKLGERRLASDTTESYGESVVNADDVPPLPPPHGQNPTDLDLGVRLVRDSQAEDYATPSPTRVLTPPPADLNTLIATWKKSRPGLLTHPQNNFIYKLITLYEKAYATPAAQLHLRAILRFRARMDAAIERLAREVGVEYRVSVSGFVAPPEHKMEWEARGLMRECAGEWIADIMPDGAGGRYRKVKYWFVSVAAEEGWTSAKVDKVVTKWWGEVDGGGGSVFSLHDPDE